MKTFASSDVQSRFGEVLDLAKRGPVAVTQYGRPVVVREIFVQRVRRASLGQRSRSV